MQLKVSTASHIAMKKIGFVYSEPITLSVKNIAKNEMFTGVAPNGLLINAQHVWHSLKVFINPAVASLPQHAHLLAEPGCFWKRVDGKRINRECGTGDDEQAKIESILPEQFKPLNITKDQDEEWFQRVKSRVIDKTEEGKQQKKELEEEQIRKKRRKMLRNQKRANATLSR